LPRADEWRNWMRIDQTIVPWTALWLFYFEDWLVSDLWKGGGEHPAESKERRQRNARPSTHPTSVAASRGGL
jgi:hypothetical protein